MIKDVLVIGGGPAGLTAALYAQRAGREVLLLEQLAIGGQMLETAEINNYPGAPAIQGQQLAENMRSQAAAAGVEIESATVISLRRDAADFIAQTNSGERSARAVIISTGLAERRMEVPGEAELVGRGVSFCTLCDAPLYADKIAGVYGGGNSALYSALELSGICEKVFLIYRGEKLRADQALIEKVRELENVEILLKSPVQRVLGGEKLTGIELVGDRILSLDGLFVQIGRVARTEWCGDLVERTAEGFIVTDEKCQTKTPGLFAAGDVRAKAVRQVATAVGDGAIAGRAAAESLN